MVKDRVIAVALTLNEVQVLLHQLTTTWAEPANQESIINITNKLKDAVRSSEGTKLG